jgi:hypothetical protein
MNLKKAMPYIFLAVLLVVTITIRRCKGMSPLVDTNNKPRRQQTTTTNRDRGFDRRVSYIDYSAHAKCRMKCRKITQEEVKDIMQNGNINYNKSDVNDRPCPTYALEGYTQKDNQHVRIVFAQCDNNTKVVTCIDLDQDFECHCPGDDKK